MFCPHCGSSLNDSCKFCTNCGAPLKQPETESHQPPSYAPPGFQATPPVQSSAPINRESPHPVTFGEAIATFFRKYADFSGRATRREYWYVFLFNLIMSIVFAIGAALAPDMNGILSNLYTLGTLIPGWSLFTRRMHDVGKSGWSWLWILLPLAGPIILICRVCRASGEDNKYGPKPI